jgi:hypothetical protein
VIVDEHQEVEESVMGTLERSGKIAVDESTHVGRLVRLARMRYARGVGDLARVAVVSFALLDGDGNVCGEISKSTNQVETYMEASVK